MNRRRLMWIAMTVVLAALAQTAVNAAQLPILSWTERSDWINVKTDVTPAAVGDGVADDTAAIQAALSATGLGRTVYFPPGTYKITSTLTLSGGNSHFGINLVGHGRSTTLAWYGGSSSNFISINGNPYARYEGLILDGRGLAASGFYFYNTLKFETSIRFKSVGLYNFTGNAVNAVTGDSYALAEVSYENCIFDHCAVGVLLGGFNDYDHTFAGCDFISCGIGINCNHGNFYARDCYFSGSTSYDIYALPEHGCSARRCKSVGSAQFIYQYNGVAPLSVQDCYVSGWTGANGAIQYQYRPAMMLANNRFVNPPDTAAPVRCSGKVLLCNNAAPSSTAVASGSALYTIPAGTYVPRVGSTNGAAITTFVNTNGAVPSVLCDAKANFGAVGDGVADDTAAIQNAINWARTTAGGAIAYIPLGNYKITSTLTVTGTNYVVGGCGYFTRLIWAGAAGGTMMSVTDPSNVRLENIMVGHHDAGAMNNGFDIAQTSVSGNASKMTYDGVYVYGKYDKAPDTKGLFLNGLVSNSTVVLNMMEGNVRLSNSAAATVIGNTTYEGSIVVDGSSTARSGFLGFMTRLNTIATYGIIARNNNNLVVSDYYTEQADNGLSLSGIAGNPSGRITIQGVNANYGPTNAVMMTINDYQGKILFGSAQLYPDSVAVKRLVQTGTRALDIVLFGGLWYNTSLSFTGTTAVVYAVANQAAGTGVAPVDNYTAQTLTNISLSVDDLQQLGSLDLDLNFPFVFPSVPPANVAPTVSITSPINGAVFTAPASITIDATASDSDGTVTNVAFYQGGTLLGQDATSPYSYTWTGVAAGSYALTALAYDNAGAVTTSAVINIQVTTANVAPTVSITAPTNGAVFTAPASITINATASDSDGTVTNVAFYQGGTLLGQNATSPYSYTWTGVAAGSYALTARAYDNAGAVTTSAVINIQVNAANVAPAVSITSPTNGAVFTAPASITINATASDSDGTVTNVAFYQGSTLLGQDATSPYSYMWTGVAEGSYALTARAYDNAGAVTVSAVVNIQLNATNLPSPWVTQDIGSPGVAGQGTYSNGTFTVKGSGADIWGTSDQFRYVYQTASGDCEMKARVTSVQNVNAWSKGGVMVRETLAANSKNALVALTPGNGVTYQWRSTTGGSSANKATSGLTAPYWVRVVRTGNSFVGYRSTNGVAWTAMSTQTVSMATNVFIGLAVTSHANSTLCTATMDNVTATP